MKANQAVREIMKAKDIGTNALAKLLGKAPRCKPSQRTLFFMEHEGLVIGRLGMLSLYFLRKFLGLN